jgi:hypothetical protein
MVPCAAAGVVKTIVVDVGQADRGMLRRGWGSEILIFIV